MAAVAVNEIRKKFGDVVAVDGISLEARDGEFMVLLGPSGCGKTTLLRIIAGLEKPTSGQILIDGQVVNDMPPRGRGIAMVFQSDGLYPHLTVWNSRSARDRPPCATTPARAFRRRAPTCRARAGAGP